MGIKNYIKNIFGLSTVEKIEDTSLQFQRQSYSQEGEDIVLLRYFEQQQNGFYVDVGAHHPFRFSNTYLFYKKGWRGINIDAMPGSMKLFNEFRKGDINLEIPISESRQKLTYHIFNEPALNTFSESEAEKKNGIFHYKIIDRLELQTFTLSEILDQYLPVGQEIDFLTIDVEGLDYKVLKSNNWDKFKPKMILIESLRSDIESTFNAELYYYLKDHGYKFVSKTFNTLFFKIS